MLDFETAAELHVQPFDDNKVERLDLPDCGLQIYCGLQRSIQSTSS